MNSRLLCLFLFSFISCLPPRGLSPEFLANRETKLREFLTSGVEQLQSSAPDSIERAGRYFELARELNENDARVLDALGCYYYRRQEFELSKFCFQRALEEEPQYDRAVAHLALIARQDGNIEAARELLQLAVRMNPLNYQQRNNLAVLGLKFGERGGFDNLLTERELIKAQQSEPPRRSTLATAPLRY